MLITIIKTKKVGVHEFKKDTKKRVLREFGTELIDMGVAIETPPSRYDAIEETGKPVKGKAVKPKATNRRRKK